MMNSYDHYSEAKHIADQISSQGFMKEAAEVRNAIDQGISGTEIFMQLRFYLSLLMENTQIDASTRSRISTLISKINEALVR